jgi:hypothetical protein
MKSSYQIDVSDMKKGYEDKIYEMKTMFEERMRHEISNIKENFEKYKQEVVDEAVKLTSGQTNEILVELQHSLTSMWGKAEVQLEATKKLHAFDRWVQRAQN